MNKYCRICWNTGFWRGPTGEAAKIEIGDSYVQQHGFGHEEWLFNFSWLQPGPKGTSGRYRYSSLQPIGKYREKYERQASDVFLYTVTPDKQRLAIATIKDLYVPDMDELKEAYQHMRRQGWLGEMQDHLASLRIQSSGLRGGPTSVMNVRFERSSVEFFEPRFVLPPNHVTYRIERYQPLNWKGDDRVSAVTASKRGQTDGKRRSEADITRAAIEGTVFSPGHVKLQNALFDYLCDRYGRSAVHYERERIDLELDQDDMITLFEIKMELTAKSCIRQAIGQLLEYNSYPNRQRRSRLVVVGEEPSTENDEIYLKHLRTEFAIPIYYARWNWETGELQRELTALV